MSKNVRNDLALTVSSLTINNVTINTPNNASYTLTLPSNTGTNGQVLTTNGSGVLSWTTVSGGGGGTVTSVAATVPAFLSAAVVNPTTTPSVNITLSGTALPVLNGGTGVTTSTGTGSNVLSINPTITSSTSTSALTVNTSFTGNPVVADFFAPSIPSGIIAQFRLGKSNTECGLIRYLHDTTATLRTFRFLVNTGSFTLSGDTATASVLNTPLSLPSMTLTTTPLAPASGGTGLSTVGTSGQYLSSNGTTLSWVNPSAGTGSVISVSLSVDSSLTGLFTNTGSGTITTSGTFTLTRVTNPTVGGNWTFSGNVAVSGTTTLTGAATAPSLSVTGQLTSTVATGTAPLVVSSTTNVPNLNASSLNGATFAAPGAIGSGSPSTGLFTSIGLTTPLSVANGGTGSVVSTGSGAVVLATSPTLVTPIIGAATGTSLSVTGQLTSTVATGTAPLVVSSTTNVPNLNASSLNGATFAAPGAIGGGTPSTGAFTSISLTTPLSTANGGTGTTLTQGTGANVFATSPTLTTPNIGAATGTSLSLSTPLSTGSGGTGLATVGTNNQVLTIVGGVPAWANPAAPGTGTVTQVGLTVDSSLSGLFTQTGSLSPITGSGTYTLSQASSPSIALTGSNFLTVSNSNTTSQAPLLVLQPNMGTSTSCTTWIGKATLFNGSGGIIQYNRFTSDTDFNNNLVLGIGTGSYLTLRNGAGATLSGDFTVTGISSGQAVFATNGGLLAQNIANDISAVINGNTSSSYVDVRASQTSTSTPRQLALNRLGGLVTIGPGGLTIGTPLGTSSGGTGSSSASTGTGGVVLNNAPTIFNPILTGNLPVDSISFPAVSGPARISLFGVAANNHEFSGFSSATNTLRYQVNTSSSNHIFYSSIDSSSSSELFRVKGTGGFLSTGASQVTGTFDVVGQTSVTGRLLSSAPIWGGKFQTASQNISSGGDTVAQDLTTNLGLNVAPGLTGSSTGYQNLTGRTVTISFTYSVFWDPAVGGGVVQAGVIKNGALLDTYGGSAAQVFSATYFASCTGSGIVELANGDFIELRVKNNLGGVLAIRGTNVGTNFISATQLFYTILN